MKIGIDMGGSHIAIGIVNENGEIVEKFDKDIKTIGDEAKNEISSYVIEIVSKIIERYNIESIGIGAPGTPKNGILTNLVNLKIKEFDITSIFSFPTTPSYSLISIVNIPKVFIVSFKSIFFLSTFMLYCFGIAQIGEMKELG